MEENYSSKRHKSTRRSSRTGLTPGQGRSMPFIQRGKYRKAVKDRVRALMAPGPNFVRPDLRPKRNPAMEAYKSRAADLDDLIVAMQPPKERQG